MSQPGNLFSSVPKQDSSAPSQNTSTGLFSKPGGAFSGGGATDASKQQGSAPSSLFQGISTGGSSDAKKGESSLFSGANQQTANKEGGLFNKSATSGSSAKPGEIKSSLDLTGGPKPQQASSGILNTQQSSTESKPNIFGAKGPTISSSQSQTQTTSAQPNIFGQKGPTISSSQSQPQATSGESKPSIFGAQKPVESGPTQSQTQATSTQSSIFGAKGPTISSTQSQPQTASGDSKPSIFGAQKPAVSGSSQSTSGESKPSIFGAQKPAESGSAQSQTQTTSSQPSVFGSKLPQTSSTQPQTQGTSSLFPKVGEAESKPKEASIFGGQTSSTISKPTGIDLKPSAPTLSNVQPKTVFGDQQSKLGTLSTQGSVFGAQQKPQGSSIGAGEDISIEGLLKSWKEDLDKQVQVFAEVNKSLEQHEADVYKNVDLGGKLLKNLQQMEKEYRAIEFACDGIDKGQNNLMNKLNVVEQELSNYLYPEQSKPLTEGKMSRTDLINQAKNLNNEISKIEKEMTKLITEMSQPAGDKEDDHLSENLLDSYFDALQFVESETLKSITKLNKIESELVSQ